MARFFAHIRFIVGALALALIVAAATPASAQVNPTASAVKEQQLLNALQGGAVSGRVSIPDQKSANLIQPAGREWRQWHEVTLRWIGGIAILAVLIIVSPVIIALMTSFTEGRSLKFPPTGFSFAWYEQLFDPGRSRPIHRPMAYQNNAPASEPTVPARSTPKNVSCPREAM